MVRFWFIMMRLRLVRGLIMTRLWFVGLMGWNQGRMIIWLVWFIIVIGMSVWFFHMWFHSNWFIRVLIWFINLWLGFWCIGCWFRLYVAVTWRPHILWFWGWLMIFWFRYG